MAQAPDETRPLYQQVVDAIEAKIASGELGEDDKVPSAKTLAETYSVASMTAQRALRELQTRGIIYGVAGRGSYVNPAAVSLLTRTAKPITSDTEYHAAMAQFRRDVHAAHTAVDEAIAGGDIDQILKARADQDQVWKSHQRQLVELTLYSQRVAETGRRLSSTTQPRQ